MLSTEIWIKMSNEIIVNFEHTGNKGFLQFLSKRHNRDLTTTNIDLKPLLSCSPEPEKCQWVLNYRPVLVNPTTGIIFGFAGGTHTYSMRLPSNMYNEAIQLGAERVHVYNDGSRLDLETIGDDWILGRWFKDEPLWCLAAYEYAGEIVKQ
jgi:hypothetical protein